MLNCSVTEVRLLSLELNVSPSNDFPGLLCNGGHGRLGCGSREGSIERLVVGASAKNIEYCGLVIDDVIAQATA